LTEKDPGQNQGGPARQPSALYHHYMWPGPTDNLEKAPEQLAFPGPVEGEHFGVKILEQAQDSLLLIALMAEGGQGKHPWAKLRPGGRNPLFHHTIPQPR
jgi:hypothetical protein